MLYEYTQISISMCIYIEIPIDHSYTDIGMHRCSVYIYIYTPLRRAMANVTCLCLSEYTQVSRYIHTYIIHIQI